MRELSEVVKFMRAAGQEVSEEPTIPTAEVMALRVRLSKEELQEFEDAVAAGDKLEMADALIDRLYVLLGDFAACGLTHIADKLFQEVQDSNMSKFCTSEFEASNHVDTLVAESMDAGLQTHLSRESFIVRRYGAHIFAVLDKGGKVMKGPKYFKPDLKIILDRA